MIIASWKCWSSLAARIGKIRYRWKTCWAVSEPVRAGFFVLILVVLYSSCLLTLAFLHNQKGSCAGFCLQHKWMCEAGVWFMTDQRYLSQIPVLISEIPSNAQFCAFYFLNSPSQECITILSMIYITSAFLKFLKTYKFLPMIMNRAYN